MTQKHFRTLCAEALANHLADQGMEDLADLIEYGDTKNFPNGLDKAALDTYYCFMDSLKKLSRLAVRLDYLPKETK